MTCVIFTRRIRLFSASWPHQSSEILNEYEKINGRRRVLFDAISIVHCPYCGLNIMIGWRSTKWIELREDEKNVENLLKRTGNKRAGNATNLLIHNWKTKTFKQNKNWRTIDTLSNCAHTTKHGKPCTFQSQFFFNTFEIVNLCVPTSFSGIFSLSTLSLTWIFSVLENMKR